MKKENNLKGKVYKNNSAWKAFSKHLKEADISKIFILTDANTSKYCLPLFFQKQHFKTEPHILTIEAGEKHKTIQTCLTIWEALSSNGADKSSLIINLGGGVVTDLGGFVASTYNRGIAFVNIPTSLLAMVDASVGGKNGVDLGHLKNQIGVINLPEMVILEPLFLETLPPEHLTSGLAEMLKHGIIYSKEYWEAVKAADFSDKAKFETLIWDSVKIKQEIVSKDPLEANYRKTLNYGHTLGHAIESYFLKNSDKKELLHGEAVAIGLILATFISKEKFKFPENTLKDISQVILARFPKQDLSMDDIQAIINLLVFDKKNKNGQVLFVLLENIGTYHTNCTVSNELIYKAFEYYKNF